MYKRQPFDITNHEGEVINIVNEWEGRPVSANLPILVKFTRFKVHLKEEELDIV